MFNLATLAMQDQQARRIARLYWPLGDPLRRKDVIEI
jgi:hypothetical protein